MVSDGLPKPSRVNIVQLKKTYKVLSAHTIDLRPEDLSTKRLDRLNGK